MIPRALNCLSEGVRWNGRIHVDRRAASSVVHRSRPHAGYPLERAGHVAGAIEAGHAVDFQINKHAYDFEETAGHESPDRRERSSDHVRWRADVYTLLGIIAWSP